MVINVESRPGQGYPRTYQDQRKWQGGWVRTRTGRLKPRSGGRLKKLFSIFANPKMPAIQDYYEPWTYELTAAARTGVLIEFAGEWPTWVPVRRQRPRPAARRIWLAGALFGEAAAAKGEFLATGSIAIRVGRRF